MSRSLVDRAQSEERETVYAEEVRLALSDLFRRLAEVLEAYGAVIGSEVVGPRPEDAALRESLARAWEARHRVVELLQMDDRSSTGGWQLHGALAAHIDRLLRDVDSDARAELRQTWAQAAQTRPWRRPVAVARSRLHRDRRH